MKRFNKMEYKSVTIKDITNAVFFVKSFPKIILTFVHSLILSFWHHWFNIGT